MFIVVIWRHLCSCHVPHSVRDSCGMCVFLYFFVYVLFRFFFFFQAEDGIRDYKVTGVQTCALPISLSLSQILLTIDYEALEKS